MNVDFITKIEVILNKLINQNKSKCLNLWELDTPVFDTWERFKELYLANKLESTTLEISKGSKPNRYTMVINGINVCPRKDKKPEWSWAAIRQFLQEASAFSFIYWDGNIVCEHVLSNEFIAYADNEKNWNDIVIEALVRGCFSLSSNINNFVSTITFMLIAKYDIEIFSKLQNKINIKPIMLKKDKKVFDNLDRESIDMYLQKNLPYSWEKLITSIDRKMFEELVDVIYFKICEDKDIDYQYVREDISAPLRTFYIKLSSTRSLLRDKIIEARVKDLKRYSDIELENVPFIDYVDAAHIYEVQQIKAAAKNNIDDIKEVQEYFLSDAENINNGLLLPLSVHRAFDKGLFNFDVKTGKVVYHPEDKEIIKSLEIENSYIKPEVLNDEMRRFLIRRSIAN